MENQEAPTPQSKSKVMPIAVTIAIVVIILVGAIAFSMSNNNPQMTENQAVTPTEAAAGTSQQAEEAESAIYKDGEYAAEGTYTSPGGAESIDVTLTLKDGVVEDAVVVSNATRPISKQMQSSFIGGFKEQVVGKKIDEINLTKVAASSLAPKGFNDAVEKIKAQAQA